MDKFYTVKGVCELFGFKDPRTARKLMRQMDHIESPLLVSERSVAAWITRNTVPPESEVRRLLKKGGKA